MKRISKYIKLNVASQNCVSLFINLNKYIEKQNTLKLKVTIYHIELTTNFEAVIH